MTYLLLGAIIYLSSEVDIFMKVINYFTRITIIIAVILIAKSSVNITNSDVLNDNINKTVDLSTMAMKIVDFKENDKEAAIDTYTGDLTGYAHNCPLCNGTLACLPSYYIKDGTNTYYDSEYGEVYIVASSTNLPCGSIVRFYSNRISQENTYAIVLDRGVRGNALDFLAPSENYASTYIGRSTITYDVLRSGWGYES